MRSTREGNQEPSTRLRIIGRSLGKLGEACGSLGKLAEAWGSPREAKAIVRQGVAEIRHLVLRGPWFRRRAATGIENDGLAVRGGRFQRREAGE